MPELDVDQDDSAVATVDNFLRLVARVRAERARDPLRRLEDYLLELRERLAADA